MKTTPAPKLFGRSVLRPLCLLASGVWLSLTIPSHGLIVSTDIEFTTVYEATVLPSSADPAWGRAGSAGTAEVSGGALTLATPTVGDRIYRIQNASGPWDGSTETGSTIEFSLRVDAVQSDAVSATAVFFSTGTTGYIFQFHPDRILYGVLNQGLSADFNTTGDFHRYRITLNPSGVASLYVNNGPTPLITGYTGQSVSTNHIYFGDPGSSAGGTALWEYVAYTNAGFAAPVPEAQTVGLLALGGGTLLFGSARGWKRRRR